MFYTQLCLYEQRGTSIYKDISLILFSKGAHSLLLIWEIDGETYNQRENFFLSYNFFRRPGGANACTLLQTVSSETSETPLIGCLYLARLSILCSVWIWPRDSHITWSPSGYTPARPACHNALPSPCIQIITWQLVKAHGATRNEPKIYDICYITLNRNLDSFVRSFVLELDMTGVDLNSAVGSRDNWLVNMDSCLYIRFWTL